MTQAGEDLSSVGGTEPWRASRQVWMEWYQAWHLAPSEAWVGVSRRGWVPQGMVTAHQIEGSRVVGLAKPCSYQGSDGVSKGLG